MDGMLKQATSNVVDAAGNAALEGPAARHAQDAAVEYLRDKKAMRFLTSVDADLDYRNTLAERATAVGDKFLEERHAGPLLGRAGAARAAVPREPRRGNDQTVGPALQPEEHPRRDLAADPPRVGARDISEGTLKIVATLRFDVKFAEEPGVAKAINVQL
jgi:hypothetical protein